ncbi:MAG: anti-sigma factor [Pirellulaceae bacterium]|nr:anti-sigma factor [Pirellulaceae bacterium]
MSCLNVQDLLVEYLLNELAPEQRATVEMHLASGCSECQAELHILAESVDALWQTIPNQKLSEELHHEILSKVRAATPDAGKQAAAASAFRMSASAPNWLSRSSLVQAFLAFAAGILCMMYVNSRGNVSSDTSVDNAPRVEVTSRVNLASPQIPASLQMAEKKYESTQLVSLRRRPDSTELPGYVLCDALTREIHIFCYGLQPPPSGMQYVLWLVGSGIETRAIERLDVSADGVCKATVRWPAGDFRYIKVTLEKSSQRNAKPSNDVALTSNTFEPFSH